MFEGEFAKIAAEAPRRIESLPGLRLSGAVPRAMWILPPFFFTFFLAFPLTIFTADPAMRLSMGPAELAQGRVVDVGNAICKGATAHRIKYTFTANGRQYRGAATVCDASDYYEVAVGETVDVRYLEHDPSTNALRTGRGNEAPPFVFFLIMPFFLLMIFAAMYWPAVREVLRARRLFKNGRLAVGQVTFVKKRAAPYLAGMPSMGAAEVFVAIATSSHGVREVAAPCRNEWLINQLSVGSTVHVAYVDESPGAALLDAYLR